MNKEELKTVTDAAIELNNAVVECEVKKRAMDVAETRYHEAQSAVARAQEAFIKLVGVGRNVPMKSVHLPDTQFSLVVAWTPGADGKGSVSVYLTSPSGAETV